MSGQTVLYVKLGGSLITEKTREATARVGTIRRLTTEIHDALALAPDMRIILGHGSGSFGHFAAERYGVHLGARGRSGWLGLAQTSAAAARLNRLVTDALLNADVPILSLQPSASALCSHGVLAEMAVEPVKRALARGLVPLVYGDVAFDRERGTAIISTEDIFAYLAREVEPTRILMVGVVDGIYEEDPLRHPQCRRFEALTPRELDQVRPCLGGSYGTDVTGGMLGKVEKLLPLLERYPLASIHLFSGEIAGQLTRALVDDKAPFGTRIRND